jgi:hypothetical protein
MIVEFSDGRRLRSNQVGDGGTIVRDDVVQLLIDKTGLTPKLFRDGVRFRQLARTKDRTYALGRPY